MVMPNNRTSRKTHGTKDAYNKVFYELNGLVKENYLLGLDTAHSFVEENKKFLDMQVDNLNSLQAEYADRIKSALESLPGEYSGLGLAGQIERMIDMQNSYFKFVKKVTDKYAKELLDLNQKSAERTFSSVDKCADMFKS
jgi:hypothetical protein